MIRQFSTWKRNKLWKIFVGSKGKNLWFFSFIILLGFTAALMEGVSFGFLLTAFSGLNLQEGIPAASWIQKYLSVYQGTKLFLLCASLAIVSQMIRSAICYVSTIAATKFSLKIQETAQEEVYNQILRMSYAYISSLKIGELLENTRAPVQFIIPMLDALNRLAVAILSSIVIVGVMFFLDFKLTLASLSLFGISMYFQKFRIRTILNSSDELSKQLTEANQNASQMLHGIKVIQTFSQQENIKSKIKKKIAEIGETTKKMYVLANLVPTLNEMISVLVLGLILLLAIFTVGIDNPMFSAILLTFLIISYRLSTRVQNAIGILGLAGGYYGYLLRMNEILSDEGKEFIPTGGIKLKDPIEEIRLEKVSFRYKTGNELVLKEISFSIRKGMVVGIVGISGSGKTSLMDLLLRLYEPVQGKISANQIDIRNLSVESWRAKFGVVSQDPFLFDETIEENIRFGKDLVPMDLVEKAAKSAGIEDLIRRLPKGYQTVVGERGLRLSGGERQRLALARALLRDPEILILDEATSNLDSQSEHFIQNALAEIQKTKTAIVIAHRLSTIVDSDLILVIEHGRLIESGTHEQLLKTQGRYSHLWELQTRTQNKTNFEFSHIGK